MDIRDSHFKSVLLPSVHGKRSTKSVFLSMVVIIIIASTPFLHDGIYLEKLTPEGNLMYYLHSIEAVSAGLKAGEFPVRITPCCIYELGYVEPMVFCNLFLLFPVLLRLLGFTLSVSYQIFAVGVNAITAWIAYYSFSRIFKDYKIGICCSALYTLSIFRIYIFVIAGAVGEGLAQIFLPLILLGLHEAFSTSEQNGPAPDAWLFIALGYGGLLQTHIPTGGITMLVVLFFCLAYIRKIWNKNMLLTLLKGAAGAVLLSLWYLIPYIDYFLVQDMRVMDLVPETIQARGIYLGQLLYVFERLPMDLSYSEDGMRDAWPAGCGMILAAGLIFFLILWYSKRLGDESQLTQFIKVCAVSSIVFMLLCLQVFPWDRLQALGSAARWIISSIRFPKYFLGWGTCLLVAVMGYCFSGRKRYFGKLGNYLVFGIMLLTVLSACYFLEDISKSLNRFKVFSGEDIGYIAEEEYLIRGSDEIFREVSVCGKGHHEKEG